MSDKTSPKIEIGVSAKAEVKTEIPSESSGRLIDALTDMIRPFSERRGLRADQIRFQREEVLIEIAKRARARLEIENAPINPIPNKVLVPLLEKASNENLDDQAMIQCWANLLASAASSDQETFPRYIQVLSELNGRQASLLERMTGNKIDGKIKSGHFSDQLIYINQINIMRFLNEHFFSKISENLNGTRISKLGKNIVKWLDRPGVAVVGLHIYTNDNNNSEDFLPKNPIFIDDYQLDFEILQSLYLISRVEVSQQKALNIDFDLHYYHLTTMGADFYAVCNPDLIDRGL